MDETLNREVYNVAWQGIRINLKGTWGSDAGALKSILVLRKYMAEKPNRTRWNRVYNLMIMVRRQYHGSNQRDTVRCKLVVGFIDELRLRLPSMIGVEEYETEAEARDAWTKLDLKTQTKIIVDLELRLSKHSNEPRTMLREFLERVDSFHG